MTVWPLYGIHFFFFFFNCKCHALMFAHMRVSLSTQTLSVSLPTLQTRLPAHQHILFPYNSPKISHWTPLKRPSALFLKKYVSPRATWIHKVMEERKTRACHFSPGRLNKQLPWIYFCTFVACGQGWVRLLWNVVTSWKQTTWKISVQLKSHFIIIPLISTNILSLSRWALTQNVHFSIFIVNKEEEKLKQK